MKVLFVHNNFPAQFGNLAQTLAADPANTIAAIGCETATAMPGVNLRRYRMPSADLSSTHSFARRFDIECRRGEQVLFVANALAASGFEPDFVLAHCGWGENLPLRSVFPKARLIIYCEYFYRPSGQDVHFDPEQAPFGIDGLTALRCQNASTLIALADCDLALSPTLWQKSTYPTEFHDKIRVAHEGVDTRRIRPDPLARFALIGGRVLTRNDEVVTYASRSLEPMRGFHIFLRAVPEILRRRPEAHVVIVGAEEASYGPSAPDGVDWKTHCLNEVSPSLDFSRVHFLDRLPRDRFLALTQVSSAHVYLTYPFVLSWSLIEAMSAGCRIVASDTQPVREVIEHDHAGILVPFRDSAAIADAVVELLAHPERHVHLGENARQVAVDGYDVRKCVPAALELLGMVPAVGDSTPESDRLVVADA
jgi:glycosyltransferase involved in cell wall biosynthesis